MTGPPFVGSGSDAARRTLRTMVVESVVAGDLFPASASVAVTGVDDTVPRMAVMAAGYASLDEVYLDILDALVRAHTAAVQQTSRRRRSMTESLMAAFDASWDVVEARLDEHRAVQYLLLAGMTLRRPDGSTHTAHHHVLEHIQRGLESCAELHGAAWTRPVDQMARFVLACLDGLITSSAVHGESAEVRRLLAVVAFDLAQHTRRPFKGHTP